MQKSYSDKFEAALKNAKVNQQILNSQANQNKAELDAVTKMLLKRMDIGELRQVIAEKDAEQAQVAAFAEAEVNKSSIRVRTKTSALSDDNGQIKTWLAEQPDVMSLYKKYEFDEMKKTLQEWLNPEAEDTDEEEEAVAPAPSKQTPGLQLNVKKKKDFDEEEFDDLFKDEE